MRARKHPPYDGECLDEVTGDAIPRMLTVAINGFGVRERMGLGTVLLVHGRDAFQFPAFRAKLLLYPEYLGYILESAIMATITRGMAGWDDLHDAWERKRRPGLFTHEDGQYRVVVDNDEVLFIYAGGTGLGDTYGPPPINPEVPLKKDRPKIPVVKPPKPRDQYAKKTLPADGRRAGDHSSESGE